MKWGSRWQQQLKHELLSLSSMLLKTTFAVTATLLLLTSSHVDAKLCTCGDLQNGDPQEFQATGECCQPPVGILPRFYPPRCAILSDEDDGYAEHSRQFAECCRGKDIESDCDADESLLDYFSWTRQRAIYQEPEPKKSVSGEKPCMNW